LTSIVMGSYRNGDLGAERGVGTEDGGWGGTLSNVR